MEIKCEYRNNKINYLNTFYTCRIILIPSASITERNQEIKAFIGKHEAGKTDRDVEIIEFRGTKVHFRK